MNVAVLYSKLSSGSCGNVGACIVNNKNRIVGCGYNEMRNNDANKNKKGGSSGLKNLLLKSSIY
jgi:deoxycytidylate deaminase